jgi:hypothetical protein
MKQTPSLTNTRPETLPTRYLKSLEVYGRLETYRRETEARDWLRRYRLKVQELGQAKAQTWWRETIEVIQTKRGHGSVTTLQADMNRMKNERT